MKRLEKIPVPCVAATLSLVTMGNVYGGLGFSWFRILIMICVTAFIVAYILKIILFPKTCVKEYEQTIPSSLYAALCMVLMVLGSFYYEMGLGFGKYIWIAAVAVHAVHIVIFTVKHAFGKIFIPKDYTMMMPSWFVTYNGIMVACVTGGAMDAWPVLNIITIYGCIIYIVLLPLMIKRLLTVEIKPAAYHTMAVMLAPCSLCVVSLINVYDEPNPVLLTFMFICVLGSLAFIIFKLTAFFSFDFYPGFAGLTFPMAIGVVATQKMAGYLDKIGNTGLSAACSQLAGLQIFLTSMLVGYVILMFIRMMFRSPKRP